MRIVITGGFGFIGSRLAAELLSRGSLAGRVVERVVLADRAVPPDSALARDPRVDVVEGDLSGSLQALFASQVDAVFHLASAVSAECERDFDLGLRANLDTTRDLLHACRSQHTASGVAALFVFSSSVAVYGSASSLPLPELVDESTLPTPQSSYGVHKFVCEQLIADYTRKGFIDGRSARLMTVAVRPGKPNAAASGFLSGIVREPLAGVPAVCPVAPETTVALSSPDRTIEGLMAVAEAARAGADGSRGTVGGVLPGRIAINLPALTVSVREMLDTLRAVAGHEVADLVTVRPDPAVEAIVGSWPSAFENSRAAALGLKPDADFESVVRQYLRDHG